MFRHQPKNENHRKTNRPKMLFSPDRKGKPPASGQYKFVIRAEDRTHRGLWGPVKFVGNIEETADYIMEHDDSSGLIYEYLMRCIGFTKTLEMLYDGEFYHKSERDILMMVLRRLKDDNGGFDWRITYENVGGI